MKGLEALEKLQKLLSEEKCVDISYYPEYELLCDISKDLNVLEIIKNKKVDTFYEIHRTDDYNEYLELYKECFDEEYILTQEEYNLLKEVLL